MAHFVEHMAFSGGKHFTKDRLREFITGSGMGFDAGTSIDKTVYELNNIPTDKENVLDSCMLIIQDWASGLSFEDQYIEKEKSIIGQEVLYIAQTGHGIVWDIQTQLFPDSKYSKKTIIGDEKVFSQFTADMLKTFYNKWYQPQFQAVVIVGDINPEEIEEKVKTLYGAIPAPAEPTVMPKYEYGNNDKSLTAITKKDDVKNISFGIYFRQGFIPKEELGSVDSFVNDLIWGLTTNIINERLGSIIGESTGSLNVADASYGNFLMSSKEYTFCLDVEIGNNDITGSSKQLMTELARLRTHGVTKGEFDRAKIGRAHV